jgi:hypothetical protein
MCCIVCHDSHLTLMLHQFKDLPLECLSRSNAINFMENCTFIKNSKTSTGLHLLVLLCLSIRRSPEKRGFARDALRQLSPDNSRRPTRFILPLFAAAMELSSYFIPSRLAWRAWAIYGRTRHCSCRAVLLPGRKNGQRSRRYMTSLSTMTSCTKKSVLSVDKSSSCDANGAVPMVKR